MNQPYLEDTLTNQQQNIRIGVIGQIAMRASKLKAKVHARFKFATKSSVDLMELEKRWEKENSLTILPEIVEGVVCGLLITQSDGTTTPLYDGANFVYVDESGARLSAVPSIAEANWVLEIKDNMLHYHPADNDESSHFAFANQNLTLSNHTVQLKVFPKTSRTKLRVIRK